MISSDETLVLADVVSSLGCIFSSFYETKSFPASAASFVRGSWPEFMARLNMLKCG